MTQPSRPTAQGETRTAAAGNRRQALGRGLGALLAAAPERGLVQLRTDELAPENAQPRRDFNPDALRELAASVRSKGILQPLLVRRAPGGGFTIIAGERRWRAAREAGLERVPAIVRDTTDAEAFELALVENIQREDLNPIEEADAYHRLISEHGLTQEELARRVGRERPTIANSLRLLRLPEPVRASVAGGALSAGHAKVLLGVDDEAELTRLAARAVAGDWSVRATEKAVARLKKSSGRQRRGRPAAELEALAASLAQALDRPCRVRVLPGEGGEVVLPFESAAQGRALLERLLDAAQRSPAALADPDGKESP